MKEQQEALAKFGWQINFAIDHYKLHSLRIEDFRNVVIAGLGGSGIGGRLARVLVGASFPVPIECVSDYSLPAFANEHTLVITCSYSGNTEETLSVFEEAQKKNCRVLVLTSGGKLKELASAHGLHISEMEGGFQPRMALGFSLTYLLLILGELQGVSYREQLLETATSVNNYTTFSEEAQQIFESIKTKTKSKFIVITDGPMEATGVRFSQQINENAKHECFCHTLPEMNHNVIESYYGKLDSLFFFIDSTRNERISSRFEFLTSLLEVEYNKVVAVPMEEFSIRSVCEVIYVLDWLSLFIADQRNVDSLNVPNIKSLKEFLEEVQ